MQRLVNDAQNLGMEIANRTMETVNVAEVAVAKTLEAEDTAADVHRTMHSTEETLLGLAEKMKNVTERLEEEEPVHIRESLEQVETSRRSVQTASEQAVTADMMNGLSEAQTVAKELGDQLDQLEREIPLLREAHSDQQDKLMKQTEQTIPVVLEHKRVLKELHNLSKQAQELDAVSGRVSL